VDKFEWEMGESGVLLKREEFSSREPEFQVRVLNNNLDAKSPEF
jgi:hypothetical protein